jgi:hypothetical protein
MARRKNIKDTKQARLEAEPIEKVLESMVFAGIVEPSEPGYVFPHVTPLKLEGPPLSEQVIADRR